MKLISFTTFLCFALHKHVNITTKHEHKRDNKRKQFNLNVNILMVIGITGNVVNTELFAVFGSVIGFLASPNLTQHNILSGSILLNKHTASYNTE